jgi:hypothetical protein
MFVRRFCFSLILVLCSVVGYGDDVGSGARKFAQMGAELPTANVYRTASGAPGHAYWQQRADYEIDVRLDENKRTITGSEVISYRNNSPDTLRYIWIQLDQNRFADNSLDEMSAAESSKEDRLSYSRVREEQSFADNQHGYRISLVADSKGKVLPYQIVDTMMRIDLPAPLKTGKSVSIQIDWSFNIIEEVAIGGRGGYEYFEETDTNIFFLAQWFPRLAAYTDYTGWQHKQFLGRGEFTLEFGDYDVSITVPEDHVVSASGELQNPGAVLSKQQKERLDSVNADEPIFIVTPEEALKNESSKARGEKTWRFKAENVRDFAWASSRKFIWDAMMHEQKGA